MKTWKEWLNENDEDGLERWRGIVGIGSIYVAGLGMLVIIFSYMCSF